MDSPELEEIQGLQIDSEHHGESMSLILETIDETDHFTPELAQSVGLMYTLYSQKQVEDVFREHPNAVVMGEFAEHLGVAVETARDGDFGEVARFIKSEANKLREGGYGKQTTEHNRIQKFNEIASILEKSAA